jgi:hypothetical protein
MDAPRQRENNLLNRVGMALAGDHFENGSQDLDPFERNDRAKTKTYLRRVVALTGSTQTGNNYVLDVRTTSTSYK